MPRARPIRVTGGDSFGGATPPISNFFGDKPAVEIMNMMGLDAEAVGNHSFDRGSSILRNELIPLADFPIISSNVVFPDGNDAGRVVAVRRSSTSTAPRSASSASRPRTPRACSSRAGSGRSRW